MMMKMINDRNIMLAESLKVLLASSYAFAIKSQNFHWNIEGRNFPEYHEFYNTLYNDVNETIDVIAEYIRILGHYTPGSLTRFSELSVIQDQIKIPRAELMFEETLDDTQKMIQLVVELFDVATENRQQGIANYMAELQDLYGKKAWFIKSILHTERE
jgi:starvation-inducible DNA-binding protein